MAVMYMVQAGVFMMGALLFNRSLLDKPETALGSW